MCGMSLFFTIYIYLRQKNPDEIGVFCEGGRRADKEGGCRIRNPTKKTGLAERCGTMSNFRGEATNFRGAMSNFRGAMSNFRGEATNFRGEATNFRGAMSNFRGEATGGNQWPLHKWIYYINEVKTHILVTRRRSLEQWHRHLGRKVPHRHPFGVCRAEPERALTP